MQSQIHPTPYADLNEVLADLVQSVTDILGDNFHAACLQGSFALGDFDRESDCDFLIVLNRELTDADVAALQAMHARIHGGTNHWATHLEGSYIRKDVLRDPTQSGSELWYLDHGANQLVRSNHCNTAVVRWTVAEAGITLAGPDARSLADSIPTAMLCGEVLAVAERWAGELAADPSVINSRWYQAFAVVWWCRMLQTMATGRVHSKLAGVAWAMAELDAKWRPLIEQAWADRPDPAGKCRLPVDPAAREETVAFVRYAIERARGLV